MKFLTNLTKTTFVRVAFTLLFAALLVSSTGCSYSAPANNAPSGTQVATGTVNSVNLTSVLNGSGGMQNATAVVLAVPLGTDSLVFCGDQRASFTLNASIQVSYTNGVYCSNLVTVAPH